MQFFANKVFITELKCELTDTWHNHVTGFKKDLDKQLACQQFGGVWHIFRGWGGPEGSLPLEDKST